MATPIDEEIEAPSPRAGDNELLVTGSVRHLRTLQSSWRAMAAHSTTLAKNGRLDDRRLSQCPPLQDHEVPQSAEEALSDQA